MVLGPFETSLRGGGASPAADRRTLHRGCCGQLHGHGVRKNSREKPHSAARRSCSHDLAAVASSDESSCTPPATPQPPNQTPRSASSPPAWRRLYHSATKSAAAKYKNNELSSSDNENHYSAHLLGHLAHPQRRRNLISGLSDDDDFARSNKQQFCSAKQRVSSPAATKMSRKKLRRSSESDSSSSLTSPPATPGPRGSSAGRPLTACLSSTKRAASCYSGKFAFGSSVRRFDDAKKLTSLSVDKPKEKDQVRKKKKRELMVKTLLQWQEDIEAALGRKPNRQGLYKNLDDLISAKIEVGQLNCAPALHFSLPPPSQAHKISLFACSSFGQLREICPKPRTKPGGLSEVRRRNTLTFPLRIPLIICRIAYAAV